MKQQEKREQKLNNVLNIVKEAVENTTDENLKKECTNTLNITGFLYSCGRYNDMQALARLVNIADALKIDGQKILEALKD